jgi:hypothetical protein
VHDGHAESGHYYTFIYDHITNKWWRYNDFHVVEEEEEKVFLESLGEFQNSSAYCLVYANKNEIFNLPENFKKISKNVTHHTQVYEKFLTSKQKTDVDQDNKKFEDEVM